MADLCSEAPSNGHCLVRATAVHHDDFTHRAAIPPPQNSVNSAEQSNDSIDNQQSGLRARWR